MTRSGKASPEDGEEDEEGEAGTADETADQSPEDESESEEKSEEDTGPFVDRQLEKAIEYIDVKVNGEEVPSAKAA